MASFFVALTASLLLHFFLAVTIYLFDLTPLTEVKKTIPFQLISADRKSSFSKQKTLSKAENTQAAKNYLTTLNESKFKRLSKAKRQKISNQASSTFESKQNNTPTSDFPSMETPSQIQSTNANQSLQGLRDIFSKNTLKIRHTLVHVSTQALSNLSDYEIKLVSLLAEQKRLYDPFHKIMANHKKDRLSYVIAITLFSNGQIKKASIKTSSGIKEIDRLAQQIAYSVSPYPPPPKEDRERGFKYEVPLDYRLTFKPDSK